MPLNNSDKILDPSAINGWHAHIYFDASNRDKAWELREIIEKYIGDKVTIGRFHEKPIGPHPDGSFQLAINNENFLHVFQWLVLNHGQLDVLVHPETGDDLRDHQISASWIGRSHEINLDKL